jgi:hypothetical protein
MIRKQTVRAGQKLVSKLPITSELLRGTRPTIRHTVPNARAAKVTRFSC